MAHMILIANTSFLIHYSKQNHVNSCEKKFIWNKDKSLQITTA